MYSEKTLIQTMRYEFKRMDHDSAKKIVCWSYESPYQDYGLDEGDWRYLLEVQNNIFAGFYENRLIGYISFGCDGQVIGGNYDEDFLDVGVGIKPDSTGKGLGQEFLRQGLLFGSKIFRTKCFRVSIALFNERAQRVCKRLGFVEKEKFFRTSDKREFIILTLNLNKGKPIVEGDG